MLLVTVWIAILSLPTLTWLTDTTATLHSFSYQNLSRSTTLRPPLHQNALFTPRATWLEPINSSSHPSRITTHRSPHCTHSLLHTSNLKSTLPTLGCPKCAVEHGRNIGKSPRSSDNPLCCLSPNLCTVMLTLSCGSCGSKGMNSMKGFRIPRFEMSRVLNGPYSFKGTKIKRTQVLSSIEDLSKLTGVLCGVVFPNSCGLRVQWDEGLFS